MAKERKVFVTGPSFIEDRQDMVYYTYDFTCGTGHSESVVEQVKKLVNRGYTLIIDFDADGNRYQLSESSRKIFASHGLLPQP